MSGKRWPIIRSLLVLLTLIVGVALAGRASKKVEAPAEIAPAEVPVVTVAAPPAEPPPPLFPSPLPIAIPTVPEGLANLSAQGCNACHGQVHDDWARSAHASAWSSPSYQAALQRTGESTVCRACHLPISNQHPRLAVGYVGGDVARPELQVNPAWDATLMTEGVTCAACHVREGKILGLHPSAGAPHAVVVSAELSSPEMCATCHQLTWPGADRPFYDTYGEWKATAWAKAGVRCQDCHMPPRAGEATATRFAATPSHAARADVGRALSILVDIDQPELQRGSVWSARVKLQNTGAGHHVPTGSPFKSLELVVTLLGADGKALAPPFVHELGRKVEDAPPYKTLSDSRIPAGGEVTVGPSFTVDQKKPPGTATLEVMVRQKGSSAAPVAIQRIPVPVL